MESKKNQRKREELKPFTVTIRSGTTWQKDTFLYLALNEQHAKQQAECNKSEVDSISIKPANSIIGREFYLWDTDFDKVLFDQKFKILKAKTVYVLDETNQYVPLLIVRGSNNEIYSWDEIKLC